MAPNKLLFPASVIGSMPRSDFVRDLINGTPTLSPEDYRKRMDDSIRYVVALQEHAGVGGEGLHRRGLPETEK
jgi:methionine synthase II (cobalamin-independent)